MSCINIDFFVPVIDNYGDAGFACSLARALVDRDESIYIWLVTEDTELAGRLLGSDHPRLLRVPMTEYFDDNHATAPLVATFFGYRFPAWYREEHGLPRELRFDYLQFDGGYHGHGGAASLHGTRFDEDGHGVTHFVPSWVDGAGGVVLPPVERTNKTELVGSLPVSDGVRAMLARHIDRPWLSVFCYPHTVEAVRRALAEVREPHLVLWHVDADIPTDSAHAHVRIPFVPLADYGRLLSVCDAAIVRGENSLVANVGLGRPTLWDAYRESSGAHAEKTRDYARNLAEMTDMPAISDRYARLMEDFTMGDDAIRVQAVREFVEDARSYEEYFVRAGEHVRTHADIVPQVLDWIRGR